MTSDRIRRPSAPADPNQEDRLRLRLTKRGKLVIKTTVAAWIVGSSAFGMVAEAKPDGCIGCDTTTQDERMARLRRLDVDYRAWRVPAPPRPAPVRRAAPVGYGGSLPPRSVMMCESKGDYKAENRHSSASGGWQIVDGTWNGHGGYSHASDAPPAVQDEKARQLWAGGRGRSHWKACL